jgi:hypothetical protein
MHLCKHLHARRHGCAHWPVPSRKARCSTAAAPGGEMVESVSLVSERGSQPTRRRESNAVVSPPSSHSAGLNCLGNPGHNPANHLRCSAGRCSHNSSMARGAQRRGSWLIGWRGPRRGCRQIKAWRASTMRAAEGGREGDWGALGSKRPPAAGRPAKSPSSRLRWLLRPSCVPACTGPSVSECLACTGYSHCSSEY